MRNAGAALQADDLPGATVYTTLQPRVMCTMASIWSKVDQIVFGAGREDVHEMYFEGRHRDTRDCIADAYRKDLTIEGGVLGEECARLYYGPDDNHPLDKQGSA